MALPVLYGIGYSPWTYKARWALSLCGIAYQYRDILPMVGQIPLRLKVRQRSGTVTLPLMNHEGQWYRSSVEIAEFAESAAHGISLGLDQDRVLEVNRIADDILELGRIRISHAVANDPQLQTASLPSYLRWLPGARSVARLGVRYMLKTYPVETDEAALLEATEAKLSELEKRLAGKAYFFDHPSFADLAVAASLQMVNPVPAGIVPLDEPLHRAWRLESLAEKFSALCEWRDQTMRSLNAPLLG
ncbi:MAG: glutathione S-transferase N-terminal domain-containing protein [Bradymonadia bacterium]